MKHKSFLHDAPFFHHPVLPHLNNFANNLPPTRASSNSDLSPKAPLEAGSASPQFSKCFWPVILFFFLSEIPALAAEMLLRRKNSHRWGCQILIQAK